MEKLLLSHDNNDNSTMPVNTITSAAEGGGEGEGKEEVVSGGHEELELYYSMSFRCCLFAVLCVVGRHVGPEMLLLAVPLHHAAI